MPAESLTPPPAPTGARIALAVPSAWQAIVASALVAAGVEPDDRAALGLAVAPGRTVLPEVDEWASRSRPHLLIGVRAHAIEVGPWVSPGISACARCVEADTLDVGTLDALPHLDPALLAMAAGWVARDVVRWAGGAVPHTWGHSWQIDDDPVAPPRRWSRHPYCGCTWFESA